MKTRVLHPSCSHAGCGWRGKILSTHAEDDSILVSHDHGVDVKGDHPFIGTVQESIEDTDDMKKPKGRR
jgi:hypothetical protein